MCIHFEHIVNRCSVTSEERSCLTVDVVLPWTLCVILKVLITGWEHHVKTDTAQCICLGAVIDLHIYYTACIYGVCNHVWTLAMLYIHCHITCLAVAGQRTAYRC